MSNFQDTSHPFWDYYFLLTFLNYCQHAVIGVKNYALLSVIKVFSPVRDHSEISWAHLWHIRGTLWQNLGSHREFSEIPQRTQSENTQRTLRVWVSDITPRTFREHSKNTHPYPSTYYHYFKNLAANIFDGYLYFLHCPLSSTLFKSQYLRRIKAASTISPFIPTNEISVKKYKCFQNDVLLENK